jgi:hypothetical protein
MSVASKLRVVFSQTKWTTLKEASSKTSSLLATVWVNLPCAMVLGIIARTSSSATKRSDGVCVLFVIEVDGEASKTPALTPPHFGLWKLVRIMTPSKVARLDQLYETGAITYELAQRFPSH